MPDIGSEKCKCASPRGHEIQDIFPSQNFVLSSFIGINKPWQNKPSLRQGGYQMNFEGY